MDRVGGYRDYRALCEDAGAYDDVVLVLAGEADAGRIRELEAKRERKPHAARRR